MNRRMKNSKASRPVYRTVASIIILCIIGTALLSCAGQESGSSAITAGSNIQGGKPAEHVLKSAMNTGSCKKLTGSVHLRVVFVNDAESSWSDSDIETAKLVYSSSTEDIKADAQRYSIPLEIGISYSECTIERTVPDTPSADWVGDASAAAGLPSPEECAAALCSEYSADSAAVIYALNKSGRAYAQTAGECEYCVIYTAREVTVAHEIFHLYGAVDLYYPESVRSAAEALGDSVMNNGIRVDPVTAYLVGWTEHPTVSAAAFLEATESLSAQDISSATVHDQVSGIRTKEFPSGTYTGALVFGIPSGKGRMEFLTGDVYDGEWKAGIQHGRGRMSWVSGDVYEGDWVENIREGSGRYTWANGNWYDGEWKDGERHGEGIMKTSAGTYDGHWVNGIKEGMGDYTYENGSVYSGEWKSGVQHGKGMLTSADGSVYDGDFYEGKMQGEGTYTSSSGSVYKGEYLNSEKNGRGIMTWASGDVYDGEWKDGLRSGTGTYTWANGDVYVGEWKDDLRSGTGTLTYKNGITLTGTWLNGEFDG